MVQQFAPNFRIPIFFYFFLSNSKLVFNPEFNGRFRISNRKFRREAVVLGTQWSFSAGQYPKKSAEIDAKNEKIHSWWGLNPRPSV